jgi:hypothetical protein
LSRAACVGPALEPADTPAAFSRANIDLDDDLMSRAMKLAPRASPDIAE